MGCTGGQHRSVYCANALAQKISASPDYDVIITHRELSSNKSIFIDD
jgi:RNase adaptor protein for sRNA GlmZ degradation